MRSSREVFTLKHLAEITHSDLQGDPTIELSGVASLLDAKKGQVSFVSNPKYKNQLDATLASVVVLSPALAKSYAGSALINNDPYLTFAKVVTAFHPSAEIIKGIHKSAVLADNVLLGKNVNIGVNVVIDSGVQIGDNVSIAAGCCVGKYSHLSDDVLLYPNVTIYNHTKIGCRSIIHSGAVIGADGFGFAPNTESTHKSWYKIPQIGNVILGSDVEVGANTTIDRATLGATVIGNGVKLDNQIQVGHNVELGENTIIAGGTVLGGSSTIGKRCQIGGAVAIAGHLKVSDDVIITGKSMVIKSITNAGVYSSGIATDENRKWRRNAARFRSLDVMAKQLISLEKRLQEFESNK